MKKQDSGGAGGGAASSQLREDIGSLKVQKEHEIDQVALSCNKTVLQQMALESRIQHSKILHFPGPLLHSPDLTLHGTRGKEGRCGTRSGKEYPKLGAGEAGMM